MLASCMLLSCSVVFAQDAKTKSDKKKGETPAVAKNSAGLTRLPSGLEYRIITDAPGTKKAGEGDFMEIHILRKVGDTVQFDTRTMNNNQPVPYPLQKAAFNGDPVEVLYMLTAGDSAIIKIPTESLRKAGMQIPPEMTGTIDMYVSIVSIKTKQEVEEETAKKAAELIGVEDKQLQDYFAKNNIKATKTASGLYYKIDAPGSGDVIKNGQTAQVMYRGTLMNGTEFDANMGPNAKHTDPLPVPVGQGRVIKGWDEGLALLKKGSKATFYIPSRLAYGERSAGPTIPPNSILIFDVEITDVK